MYNILAWLGTSLVPLIIVSLPLYALYKRTPVYDTFIEGAKESFPIILSIIPHLVGMMAAINVFYETGALSFYLGLLKPLLHKLPNAEHLVPILLLRPLTGTGALALLEKLYATFGPDALVSKIASTLQGSSETTFYVFTVYFGAVGIKKSMYALKVALLTDLLIFFVAILVCTWLFG
ncbi:MAG: hypothetical protein RLZ12_987 [Bacillota bacterium]|jgi:spore maturation protein B